jgi:tetratricopeptide (TPR) repeat protein
MVKAFTLVALATVCAAPASAQFKNGSQSVVLDLPKLSPRASVTQRIGLTDITVVYHRPRADGRKIFGALIGYGRVWRAGANDNTTIAFADPVTVDGHPLAPGTYGVHMIPTADLWTVIFSTNATSWGSFSYRPEEDALRIQVKPIAAEFHDELIYEFGQLAEQSAVLSLKWERVAVPMTIGVDVHKKTLASIRQQLRNLPGFIPDAWNDAAMYCLDIGGNYDEALTWIDRSIEQDPRFENMSTKVKLLDATNRKAEAIALLEKALPLASPPQLYSYADELMKAQRRDEGLALFKTNAERNPSSWIAIAGRARAESARGDRAAARRSLTDALSKAPGEGQKVLVERLLTRLDAGEDIG